MKLIAALSCSPPAMKTWTGLILSKRKYSFSFSWQGLQLGCFKAEAENSNG